jgi:hypothetical protein
MHLTPLHMNAAAPGEVQVVLVVIALILTVISGITGRLPLWIPLLLLCIAVLAPAI